MSIVIAIIAGLVVAGAVGAAEYASLRRSAQS